MLYFITANKPKIQTARFHLQKANIALQVKDLNLSEVQSTSIEKIAEHKAQSAFAIIKKPLIVKDDGWFITSLNGFPGAYMKYINQWFTPEDFIRLLDGKENREALFYEVIHFIDGKESKSFTNKLHATILYSPKGDSFAFSQLVTFRKDKKTMAQCDNENIPFSEKKSVWETFADWYKNYVTTS